MHLDPAFACSFSCGVYPTTSFDDFGAEDVPYILLTVVSSSFNSVSSSIFGLSFQFRLGKMIFLSGGNFLYQSAFLLSVFKRKSMVGFSGALMSVLKVKVDIEGVKFMVV
jgi:hypothetical protein